MIIYRKLGVAYFSVPKAACTSIKSLLHELEHGAPFAPNNRHPKIHTLYKTTEFDRDRANRAANLWKVAIVRDPIQRILSAYARNRGGIGRAELRQAYVSKGRTALTRRLRAHLVNRDGEGVVPAEWQGMKTRPSLDEFCELFAKYRETFKTIRHHTRQFADYLGDELDFFERVYRIEDLHQFEIDLSERLGKRVRLPHLNKQRVQTSTEFNKTSRDWQHALVEATAPDYAFLKGIYQPPAISIPFGPPSHHLGSQVRNSGSVPLDANRRN